MIIQREQYQLSATAANGALRDALRGKSSPEVAPPQLQIHCPKQSTLHCHELNAWQAHRQNHTLKHNPLVKSTSPDLCAHDN